MDDSDCSEVTFDDLGWDCFFPCLPEKGVDLSGIYVINPAGPRRWQDEEGEQSSSEDEDVDPATRALPLKSYLISEVGGATATPGEPQWYCQDEGSLDDFDWDNYVPARLGRYKPTYAFVLTHGHGHNPSLYYDKDAPLYDSRRDYGKDGPFCGSFPTYSACAPHYNTVAIEPRDVKSGNCYVFENFEAENGRQNVLRTVNPQYLMFPPPEELYQSFNKATGGVNNTRAQNHYKHKYQTGSNSKHSFASQKSRFNDKISQKKSVRNSGSTTVNNNSSFAVSSGKVTPESSSFRLKSSTKDYTSASWTKSKNLSRTTNSPGVDGSTTSSNVTKLGQEINNKENRGNRPPENPTESDRNRNVTTKSHQNVPPPEGKRRRVRRFFLGYMKTSDSLNDIKEAIYSHAREKGVELTYVRMMKNERQGVVFARVNVAIEQANIVLQENFWPSDMIFRPWLSKAKYKEQGGTTTRMPHIEEEYALEVSC